MGILKRFLYGPTEMPRRITTLLPSRPPVPPTVLVRPGTEMVTKDELRAVIEDLKNKMMVLKEVQDRKIRAEFVTKNELRAVASDLKNKMMVIKEVLERKIHTYHQ